MEILLPLLVIVVGVLAIASRSIRIVPQATALVIERLGRFERLAPSGLNVIIPFLDRPRGVYWMNLRPGTTQIDLREQFTDLPPQPVITRDNVTIHVDSVIYWQITDPIKSVYEVSDLVGGIIQLTITAMRNVIGELDLDHALSSRHHKQPVACQPG
jgi:regulator of protease activity HflC (stomatin/prohibitin superfamily)